MIEFGLYFPTCPSVHFMNYALNLNVVHDMSMDMVQNDGYYETQASHAR